MDPMYDPSQSDQMYDPSMGGPLRGGSGALQQAMEMYQQLTQQNRPNPLAISPELAAAMIAYNASKPRPPEDYSARGVVMPALRAAGNELLGLTGKAGAAVAGAAGLKDWQGTASKWGDEKFADAAAAGRPDLENFSDQTLSSALPYAAYQGLKMGVQAAPLMAAQFIPGVNGAVDETLLGSVVARGIAQLPKAIGGAGLKAGESFAARRAALGTGANTAKNLLGGTIAATPMGVGAAFQSSEQGGTPNPWGALAAGPAAGVAMSVLPASTKALMGAGSGFEGNLLTRIGKGVATESAINSGMGLAQNELNMQFNPNLSAEERNSMRLNTAAAGAVGSLPFGVAAGLHRYSPPVAPTAQDTETIAHEQQLQQDQQQAQQQADASNAAKLALRMKHQPDFMSKSEFINQLAAAHTDANFPVTPNPNDPSQVIPGPALAQAYDAHRAEMLGRDQEPMALDKFRSQQVKQALKDNKSAWGNQWASALDKFAQMQEERERGRQLGDAAMKGRIGGDTSANDELMHLIESEAADADARRSGLPTNLGTIDVMAGVTPFTGEDLHAAAIQAGIPISGYEQMDDRGSTILTPKQATKYGYPQTGGRGNLSTPMATTGKMRPATGPETPNPAKAVAQGQAKAIMAAAKQAPKQQASSAARKAQTVIDAELAAGAITPDEHAYLTSSLQSNQSKANSGKTLAELRGIKDDRIAAHQTFDNVPEFTDWALGRVGADDGEAEAYKRYHNIGEFQGDEPVSFDALRPLFGDNPTTGKPYSHMTVKSRLGHLKSGVDALATDHLALAHEDSAPGDHVIPEEHAMQEAARGTNSEGSDGELIDSSGVGEGKVVPDTWDIGDFNAASGAGESEQAKGLWSKLAGDAVRAAEVRVEQAKQNLAQALENHKAQDTAAAQKEMVSATRELEVSRVAARSPHKEITSQWGDLFSQVMSEKAADRGEEPGIPDVTKKARLTAAFNNMFDAAKSMGAAVKEENGRKVKPLQEKDTFGPEAAKLTDAAEKLAKGDMEAAADMFDLLAGKNSVGLMQALRVKFGMPARITKPKEAVEYFMAAKDRKRHAAMEMLASRKREAEAAWDHLPGTVKFDELSSDARVDFARNLSHPDSILAFIKKDFENEHLNTSGDESMGGAAARATGDSQPGSPGLGGTREAPEADRRDSSQAHPNVQVTKKRVVAAPTEAEPGLAPKKAGTLSLGKKAAPAITEGDLDGIHYRAGDTSSTGLTKDEFKEVLHSFIARYKGAARIKADIYDDDSQLWPGAAGQNIQGAYLPASGSVLFVAANHSSKADALQSIRHEILGHYGIDLFRPEDKQRILNEIKAAAEVNPALKKMYAMELKETEDADRAAFEVLGNLAEHPDPAWKPLWDKIVSLWNQALIHVGLRPDEFRTLGDIRDQIRLAATGVKEGYARQTLPATNSALFRTSSLAATAKHLGKPTDDIISKLPREIQPAAIHAAAWFKSIGDKRLGSVFAIDLRDMGSKYLAGLPAWYREQQNKAVTFSHLKSAIEAHGNNYYAMKLADRKAADAAVDYMDRNKVWGFPHTTENGQVVAQDTKALQMFRGLTSAAQKVVRDHFEMGTKMLTDMRDASLQTAREAYNDERALAGNDQKALNKAERVWKLAQAEANRRFTGRLDLPYSPRVRKGDYVLIGKSAAYRAAQDAGDRKAMEAMESDGNHYLVKMGSRGAMDIAARDYANDKRFSAEAGGSIENLQREKYISNEKLNFQQIDALRRSVMASNELDDKTKQLVTNSLNKMYVNSLADTSSRRSGLLRKDVEGYDPSRIAAALDHYDSTAHLIATMRHSKLIEDSLATLKQQARSAAPESRDMATKFANEVLFRHALSMIHVDNGKMATAMKLTAANRIITSPAFYFQQLTEPWVVMLPMLGSRHGYASARREMFSALGEAARILDPKNPVLSILTHGGDTDVSKYVSPRGAGETARMREYLQRMVDTGRLDFTQMRDIGEIHEGNPVSIQYQKWFNKINQVATNSETLNRVTSALSAYRLEYAKALRTMNKEDAHAHAMREADTIVARSHGEYNAWAAPRYTMQQYWNNKGIPLPSKLIFQFKKFELMRTILLARQMKDAFAGATPEEKLVARKYLAYTFAHYGALAGATGMPGYSMASLLVDALFGDKDKPVDPEQHIFETVSSVVGQDVATLLLKGLPAVVTGVDVGKKIGAGSLGTGMFGNLNDIDVSSKKAVSQTIMGLMGPAVGMGTDVAQAVYRLRQGDYQKGLELLLPAFARDLSITYRMNTKGLTNSKNDVLLRPEDMSVIDKFASLAGFSSTDMSIRRTLESSLYTANDYYKVKLDRLAHKYASAARAGDSEELAALRNEFQEYQQAQRDQGMVASPMSRLFQAVAAQNQREARTMGGVQWNKQTRGMVLDSQPQD